MMKRLMTNPYRRESSNPELEIILQDEAYFPGDTLVGLVRLDLEYPFDLVTLEVEITGAERAVVGGFLYTATNPEVKRTTYYQQYVTLLGMSHDVLVANAGIKKSSAFFRPAAYLPTRKDAPAAQFRPVEDAESEENNSGEAPPLDSASRRSSSSLYNPSTFGDTSGLDVVQLLPGSYTCPFSVVLPATLPPTNTVVRGREAEAKMSYTVTARLIHKNGKSHFKAVQNFEVVALSVQLQRWLQLHRRNGTGMTAEECETGTTLSRQTSGTAVGATPSDDDDDGKVSLRRLMDHTLQFSAEELERDEETFQREERRRRKEKKKKQKKANKKATLTVEMVESLDENGVPTMDPSPVPEENISAEQAEEEEPESPDEARLELEKEQRMNELLELQQWEETFTLPLRNSVLKKALVGVHIVFNTVVLARGLSRLCVTSMIDNVQGSSNISRLKYTLVTRSRVWSKKENFKFETKICEVPVLSKVEKGKVARIDSVDIVIPPEVPLTMVTDGAETRTFLNMRLYVHSPLKTYSRSLEVEVLITNGVDTRNMSRRLRTWTCDFRNLALGKKAAGPPPCIDLSARNKEILLLDGAEGLLPAEQPTKGSATRTRMDIHNFEQATFTPLDSAAALHGGAGNPDHMDPMAGVNPFVQASEDEMRAVEPRRSFDVVEQVSTREYPPENES